MSYTFSRTREQLRDMIGRKLGIKEAGQDLPPEDSEIILEAIDLRLKELHTLHILWPGVSGAQTTVAITGGLASATIGATDYAIPLSLMLVVGTEQQRVDIIGHREYQAIPDKAKTGEPEKALIHGSTVLLYPVPLSSGSLKLTYVPIAEDTAASAAVDVPVSMLPALADLVASGLVDDFNVEPARAARLMAREAPAMRTIRALAVQHIDATTVAPDWF